MVEQKNNNENYFLPLLPLKNVVILPKSIIPIIVGRKSSIDAVEYALKENRSIFVTAQKHAETENPTADDVFAFGTRATILQVMRMPKGAFKILIEGVVRSKILSVENTQGFMEAECQDVPTRLHDDNDVSTQALWRNLQSLYTTYGQLNTKSPADLMNLVKTTEDMDCVVDTLLMHINVTFEERQSFLETIDLQERLVKLCALLQKEISILEAEERIRGRVQNQIEKNQREYYLTEQIKAIQKELGRDDQQIEIAQLRAKIKSLNLPEEPLEKAEKELRRLEQMPAMSSEAVVSRHYIDWIISLPWHKITRDTVNLNQAENILNKRHAGLKKPKERILEFLAAEKFTSQAGKSPIICLVGPPGVGKTSLGQAIAESLGRKFIRISLGGVRDEAEIRGHRRTYIGALPGRIIQAMRRAKSLNPVILLDEIDKMSVDLHGDPGSALLEVLDPEQNNTFMDHYLELEYNLSQVMFIATANTIDKIPYPLFDRMEIIPLSGYSDDEKLEIAHKFLIPKSLKEYGLKARQFKLSNDVIMALIRGYSKEAGVRQLERLLNKLMRKCIQIFLTDTQTASVTVTVDQLKEWLGHPPFKIRSIEKTYNRVGLASGLAWTELGGDLLEVEALVMPGKGNVSLTGQLGEVMQESAQAALSYIRSRTEELSLPKNFNTNKDIHIHLPEGSTPKEGPSAGITMCIALVSALTKNPVNPFVAMTGEITLHGQVLPIGGVKEKILAAHQHGITTVILPSENRNDIDDIKNEFPEGKVILESLNLVFVDSMDEALKKALINNPFEKKPIKKKRTLRAPLKTRKPVLKDTNTPIYHS